MKANTALKAAAENSMIVLKSGYDRMNEPDFVDKDSILSSYPETLIK